MSSLTRERIGTALQAMAADLVTERQRVRALQRENRELRDTVAALRLHQEVRPMRTVSRDTVRSDDPEDLTCPCCGQPIAGLS
jgi:hypothetical protein